MAVSHERKADCKPPAGFTGYHQRAAPLPRFRKDVLTPDTYSVLNQDGKGRRIVTYTGDDCRHLLERFYEMKAAKRQVPGAWEHQDEAKPDTPEAIAQKLADKARLYFGKADEAVLLGNDVLAFEFDVSDEADAKKLEAIGAVSPEIITDWTDGYGRMWPGKSITHVAVTPRPVQHIQQPFQRLSLANVVRLSLADRLGDVPMADISQTLAYLAKRKIKLPAATTPANLLKRLHVVRLGFEEGDAGEAKADEATEGEGGDKSFKKALEYLEGQGLHLPPDTTIENFVERLCVACHALENSSKTEDEVTTDVGTPTPAPDSSPVMMSLQRRVENAEKRALNLERDDIDRRIKALRSTGRVAKPLADKLMASLKTERLSLDDNGSLASCKLLTQVEAFEQLDVGHTTDLLSNNRPQPVPDPEEEAQKPDDHVMHQLTGGRWTPASKNGK